MFFYIVFILTEFVLLTIRGRKRYISYLIAFWIMVIISLIRFDVGYDYPTYFSFYNSNNTEDLFDPVEALEPLSRLIIYVSRFLGSPYWIMIIFGSLTYLFLYLSLKDFKYKNFGLLVYLCFLWLSSLDLMRQSLAISILLYGYKYVIEKRLFKYLLVVAFGSLFHSTALVGGLIYIIYQKCNIKRILLLSLLLVLLFSVVFNWMASLGIYAYVIENTLGTESGNKLVFFYSFFYFLVVFLYYNNIKSHNEVVWKTLLVISISLIFFFTLQGMSAWRIGLYFISLYIYILPRILAPYSEKNKLAFSMMLMAFFLTTILVSTSSSRSPFIPYDVIFNHLDTSKPNFRF